MAQTAHKVRAAGPGPLLTPLQVLEMEDDPSKVERFARLLGATNLDALYVFMQTCNNPMARLEFQKILNKMGRIDGSGADTAAGGPQVVINITRAADRDDDRHVTIEGVAVGG